MFEFALIPVLGFIFEGLGFFVIPHLVGAIWASGRAIKYTSGAATPVWLAFIWLVPCIGPILALFAIPKHPPLPPA